jgi:hypothetical protein
MGKVSDKDFSEMGARLRARAGGLIHQLDAGTSYRQAIEAEIEKRVGRADVARSAAAERSAAKRSDAGRSDAKTTTKLCLSCCTPNDPDARFCKGCGYQLGDW